MTIEEMEAEAARRPPEQSTALERVGNYLANKFLRGEGYHMSNNCSFERHGSCITADCDCPCHDGIKKSICAL